VYVEKGRKGLRAVKQPVSLPPEAELEMLYALAAKLLPLVRHLQVKVPEFREATTDVLEVMVVVESAVKRDGDWPMAVESAVKRDGDWPMAVESAVKRDGDWPMAVESAVKRDAELPMVRDIGVRFDDSEVDSSWLNVRDAPPILPESWKYRKSGIKSWKKSSEPLSPEAELEPKMAPSPSTCRPLTGPPIPHPSRRELLKRFDHPVTGEVLVTRERERLVTVEIPMNQKRPRRSG
jgi:hypothetical protein